MNSLSLQGACPVARRCPLAGARLALRPGHSPAPACQSLSATAAPWASATTSTTVSTVHRTARRALHVGVAARSAPDPWPTSQPGDGGISHSGPHSHAGGQWRGRGRQGGSGAAQGPGGWQGRGRGGGGGRQGGERAPAPSGQGRGRGRGRGRGHSSDRSRPSHLGQLQEHVRQGAKQWADERNYNEFFWAFNEAGKLRPDPAAGRPLPDAVEQLRPDIMHTLAGSFLPLVPSLPHPKYCVMPLWACAKTQYGWAGHGGGEVPLAEALLRRLGQEGCAMLRQANAQDHSNLWWALSEAPNAGLVKAHGQLLAAAAECLVGMRAKDLVAQDCANVLLACARLQHRDARLVHHMTACLAELLSEATNQALSNALYALGELREDCGHVPHPEDLRRLVGAVVQRLRGGQAAEGQTPGGFPEQAVSNMLLGCVKLGVEDGEAVQLLAASAGAAAWRMTGQGLANSVWALGKLLGAGGGGGSGSPWPPAPRHLAAGAGSAGAGSAGAAAVGGARGTTARDAVMELLREVQRRVKPSSTPAHVLDDQALSNTLYGMALLQPYILRVAETAEENSKRTARSAVLTAATKALAGECTRRSFGGFVPQELANASWALAQLSHADQGWFAAAVAAAQRPAFARTAIPTAWTQLWSALALVRHRPPPELLDCTARALMGQTQRLDPQACALLLWSFAVLGVWEERLAGVLLGRLAEVVELGQGQEVGAAKGGGPGAGSSGHMVVDQSLSNALWAVAVTGPGALTAHAREVGLLLSEAYRRWELGASFASEALQQLWQVQLELEALEGGGPAALSSILPGAYRNSAGGLDGMTAAGNVSLLGAMEQAADEQRQGGDMTVSALQREVAAALRRLQQKQHQQQENDGQPEAPTSRLPASQQEGQAEGGAAATRTHSTTGSCIGAKLALAITRVQLEALVLALRGRVDVLVELSDGRVVAVEVDGPVHYMSNSPCQHTKDGPTVLRDRQLARVFGQGNVVLVPYWEWNALRGDQAVEEAYLWGLLVWVEGTTREDVRAVVAAGGPRRL